MDKECRDYMKLLDTMLKDNDPAQGGYERGKTWEDVEREMLTRIGFFQHERLVHLIVTMTVAVATVVVFVSLWVMPQVGLPQIALMLLLLVLLVPYMAYYFMFENAVQAIYAYYNKVRTAGLTARDRAASAAVYAPPAIPAARTSETAAAYMSAVRTAGVSDINNEE